MQVRRVRGAVSVLVASLALPVAAFGQVAAVGTISGTVQDATGAVIPGAEVSASNIGTGQEYTATTGPAGRFNLTNIAVGDYMIAATAEGFKTATTDAVRVNAGQDITVPFSLEIGAVTEVVEVEAAALQVDTTSGQIDATVQVEQILELPMPNRNVFTLVNLVPGAFFKNGRVSIGGGRTQSALAMVDGVNNTRGGLGVQNIELSPPVDSMQEFNVKVNAMGAEYGRSSAGVINAVTRSGSNEFHASLYEFLRNDALDATGWNNDSKPKLRRNNFGGTFGGPVIKNRTFFFYNLDMIRQRTEAVRTRSVGLPEFLQGDFSNATGKIKGEKAVVPIHDPLSGTGTFSKPKGTTQFPNNIIPSARFDRVAAAVASGGFIPSASRAPNNSFNNSGNWQENVPNQLDRDYHTMKIDHRFTEKLNTYARWIFTKPDNSITGYSQGYGVADQNGLDIINRRQNLALNGTYMFSPTLILNATAGFNRVTVRRFSGDCCETNYAQQFGLPETARVGGEVFPRFNFGGGLVPVNQIGAAGNAHRFAVFTNFDWSFNFTKVQGNHSLKFGFQHSRFQGNEVSRPQPSGVWGFNGRWTQKYNNKGGKVGNTGIRFADFLLGRLNSADARVAPMIGKRIRYYSGYFQDDWKVTSRLTFNLGMRYETETPITEVGGRLNGWCEYCPSPLAGQNGIPEGAIGIHTFPNRNGVGKYLWNWDKNNIAPRFGFALRLTNSDRLVLRGGYGIFYGNPYDRNTIQVGRNGFDNIYKARHPVPFTLQDGVPTGSLDNIPEEELTPNFGARGTRFETSTVQYFGEDRATPYSQNANLNIQTQFGSWLFEVGVMTSLGRQVAFPNINLNHIRTEDLPRLDPDHPNAASELSLRPWQTLTSTRPQIQIMAPNWGMSNAWMGTFKAERRYQNGFGMNVAYTYTSWVDNVIFTGGNNSTFGDNDQIQNIYNLSGERAASTNSIPHRIVLAPIWDLPFGRGRQFGSGWHPVLDAIAGGWQVSTIATLRTGGPFGLVVQDGPRNILGDDAPGRTLRPTYASGVSGTNNIYAANRGEALSNGNVGIAWLNEDAFLQPEDMPLYTHGSVSRTVPGVLGPNSYNYEFMLAKNFRFRERFRMQLRWELFNMFNSPQFNLPGQTVGGNNFGEINGAGGRRINQLGLKLYW